MPRQSDLRFTFDVKGTLALDVVEFHFALRHPERGAWATCIERWASGRHSNDHGKQPCPQRSNP